MKKIGLIIAAISGLTLSTIAQNNNNDNQDDIDSREKFTLGVKIGANYSNVYDTKGEDFKADGKFGVAGGVYLGIPLGKYFGIQPEILFSQRGFKGTGKIYGYPYEVSRTLNYIDVPIFFAIKPTSMVTLLVGPQFSFLTSQSDKFTNDFTNVVQSQAFSNENIRKNTLCFVLGADFTFDRLILGARAGIDAMNNNGDGTSTTPRYKNAWFQATVGFRLL